MIHSQHTDRLKTVILATVALVAPAAHSVYAQEVEFNVIGLGDVPGSTSTVPTRMNNLGHVVGWAVAPNLVGWLWTPEDGMQVLPAPPGFSTYRATDISDTGIISGDGGYDNPGAGWRLVNGAYETLGVVDGAAGTRANGINDFGDITGEGADGQLITPNHVIVAPAGGEIFSIANNLTAAGTDINNATQVCGYVSLEAIRWSEGLGVQFIGPLDNEHVYTFAWAINELGHVVGAASSQTGNSGRPFIFTDELGMQEIPSVGGEHNPAVGVNVHDEVVGVADLPPGGQAWLWRPGDVSTRSLSGLVNPSLLLAITNVMDINDAGQMAALAFDNIAVDWSVILLDPIGEDIVGDLDGDGSVSTPDLLLLLGAWGNCPPKGECPADLDADGVVGTTDLLILLGHWD